MTDSTTAELEDYLRDLISKIFGLRAVFVTDKDGVVLCKVLNANIKDVSVQSAMSVTFAQSADQAGKCGLGKAKSIISIYSDRSVVNIAHLPIVISFVGTTDMNIGLILAIQHELKKALDPLQVAIKSVENEI